MNMAAMIQVGMGICSILILLYLIYQFGSLRSQVGELAGRTTGTDDAAGAVQVAAAIEPVLTEIQDALNRVERRLAGLDSAFSDLHVLVDDFTHGAQEPLRSAPSAPPPPSQLPPPLPVREQAEAEASAEPGPFPGRTEVTRAAPIREHVPEASASAQADAPDVEALLVNYRQLIAQPQKSEINRWADENGGEACEVHEDGTFHALSRDAGGLLILLRIDADRAVVLPGGRLVADFATNFANAISMRSVTRDCFDLVNDGSGVIRLIEPALARRSDGRWQLARAGKAAGFTSH